MNEVVYEVIAWRDAEMIPAGSIHEAVSVYMKGLSDASLVALLDGKGSCQVFARACGVGAWTRFKVSRRFEYDVEKS